jgi:hypothetical protein
MLVLRSVSYISALFCVDGRWWKSDELVDSRRVLAVVRCGMVVRERHRRTIVFFNALFRMSSRWWNDDKFVERRRPVFIARYCCSEKKGRAPWEFYFTFDLLLLCCLTRNRSVYTPFPRGKHLVTYYRFLGVHYRIDCSWVGVLLSCFSCLTARQMLWDESVLYSNTVEVRYTSLWLKKTFIVFRTLK